MSFSQTPVRLKPGKWHTAALYIWCFNREPVPLTANVFHSRRVLHTLNLLSVNSAPDRSKDENKVNMILNALSIRIAGAQIWRRVAPVKAFCLQLSRYTRAVISDACETLAEARDDPRALACLREQMCHPLATVVPYPQWPCGRRGTSCGLKMIPHLTSSHVGCREGASLWEEGEGEEGRNREGVNSTHIYRINIYPKFFSGANTCCIFV